MEQMTADSTPRKPKHPSISRHTGDELQQDLAHLMYNAAQRAKAWVDGRHETKKMRIQRSPSFENAMRIMEQMEQAPGGDEEPEYDLSAGEEPEEKAPGIDSATRRRIESLFEEAEKE